MQIRSAKKAKLSCKFNQNELDIMTVRTFKLPDIGEVSEIEISEILVSKGQKVVKGEPMLIIESDKSTIEVPADSDGIIGEIFVVVGDEVQQETSLLNILDASDVSEASEVREPPPEQAQVSQTSPSTQQQQIPDKLDADMNVSITVGTPTTPAANTNLGAINHGAIGNESSSELIESVEKNRSVTSAFARVKMALKSTPSARKLAADLNIDINDLVGTGRRNTITPQDVVSHHEKNKPKQSNPQSNTTANLSSRTRNDSDNPEEVARGFITAKPLTANKQAIDQNINTAADEAISTLPNTPTLSSADTLPDILNLDENAQVVVKREAPEPTVKAPSKDKRTAGNLTANYQGNITPLTKIQTIVAERMAHSWQTIPHVTQNHTVDVTELLEKVQLYKQQWKDSGIKITPLAFVAKALALAMSEDKLFSSVYDDVNQQLILTDSYDIGFAVDTNPGLVVPVLRDCLRKDVVSIATEIVTLSHRARNRKLLPAEMQGGVFTISSLGSRVKGHFGPIIFPPQVAILGVSGVFEKFDPVRRGAMTPHLPLSLSYDHRVVNGADAVRFLELFENALLSF